MESLFIILLNEIMFLPKKTPFSPNKEILFIPKNFKFKTFTQWLWLTRGV